VFVLAAKLRIAGDGRSDRLDEGPVMGPIVRNTAEGKKQLVHARWGPPSPIFVQKKAAEARAEKLKAKDQVSTLRNSVHSNSSTTLVAYHRRRHRVE